MDVGHSRLLKFFTDKPKMEKHTLKIEVLAPTDIESEVPRHQKLREPTEPKESPKTTQLQNDQPIEWIDLRDMLKKPVHVGIRDAVIRTQRIRAPRVADETPAVEDKTSSEDKPQTRIPVSRFKPAVERWQRERRESREGNKEKSKSEAPEKPRRTSIPKLRAPVTRKYPIADDDLPIKADSVRVKDAKDETSEKNERRIRRDRIPVLSKDHYKIVKRDDNAKKTINKNKIDTNQSKQEESVKHDSNEKLDDEFDKLYEEIVDTDIGSLPVEILETKVKDPEKLESKFEEIVHQYDETVEQVEIEPVDKARYSKIPLFRRRSSQDVKIPKQFERTLSLKIGDKTVKSDEKTKAKIKVKDDEIKPNGVIENATVESPTEPECELAQGESFEINNNNDGENHDIAPESPNPIPAYNTIPTPDSERVKVGLFGISTREIPLEDNASLDLDVTTPVLETVKLAVIDIPAEEQFKNVCIETEDTKPVHVKESTISRNTPQNGTFKEGEEVEVIKALDRVISTKSDDILDDADVIQNEPELKIKNDVNDQKERIKTATIQNDTIIENIENSTNVPQEDILNPKFDDELKSVGLLQKSNNVKERNTSRYVMKPVSNEIDKTNDPTLVEKIPITKGNVSKILKRLTSQELSNNCFNEDNDIDVKKQEIDVKKEIDDIPKKKSVVSKIAMFERAEPEPPFKPPHRFAKPKRSISEEIRHLPKIVHEVLKPKGEQTDQHTVVTVDIMKPAEILTNNEEQVTIVENLSEKVIEYDNLDTFNLSRVEPIEIEAKEQSNTHEKETIIRDDSRLYNTEIEEPEDTTEDIEARDLNFEDDVNTSVPQYIESNHDDQNSVTEIIRPDYIETLDSSHINSNNNIPYDNNDEYKTPEPSGNIPTREHKPKHSIRQDDYKLTLPNNIESIKNELYNQEDKVEKWKSTEALADYVPVKEKINRLKSHDDTNMKKAKSTAELDLGDAVKGKVKNMIVRMNSCELLDDVKTKEVAEVINVKERPRKRSVSEKIALFERKLTPVAMEDIKINIARSLNIDAKSVNGVNAVPDAVRSVNAIPDPVRRVNAIPDPVRRVHASHDPVRSVNSIPEPVKSVNAIPNAVNVTDEYAARIKELKNAKLKYGSVSNMGCVELRDGRQLPVLALGTALLDPRLARHIVAAAIDLGYRAIDTAYIYGNEREVGEGIRDKIRDGTVAREELFIISKLWSTFHRPDLVEGACRASLAATGLEYFDLYLIHNPMSFKEGGDPIPKIANVLQFSSSDYLDAWFAMEALVAKGLARSLGVSNFNSVQLARVLDKGRVKPVVNQVECHPYLSQQRLSDFCDARDVRLSCFGVLGSKGTPAEYKATQAAVIDDPLVQVMAAGLGISPAQLLIRYQIDSGHNVVVKASSAAHLWDNLQPGPALQPAQLAALRALDRNKRTFTFKGMGDTHRNYPFKIPF